MKTSESIDKITKALAEFQANVEHPQKDTEGYGYMYAPLENVINTVKPTLEDQGLAVTQSTVSEGEKVGVTTVLWHESGQYIEFDQLTLPRDDGQQRSGAQAAGSSITYARRYALSAALGIASEEDTDAAPKRDNKSSSGADKKSSKKNSNDLPTTDGSISDSQQELIFNLFSDQYNLETEMADDFVGTLKSKYIEDLSMQEASNLITLLKDKEDKAQKMIDDFKNE